MGFIEILEEMSCLCDIDARYQQLLADALACLKAGESTGDLVLDDAIALRTTKIFEFAEAVHAINRQLKEHLDHPVVVLYSANEHPALGMVAGPRLLANRLTGNVSVPARGYIAYDIVTGGVIEDRQSGIPLGNITTAMPPSALREHIFIGAERIQCAIQLMEKALAQETGDVVDVKLIGTGIDERRSIDPKMLAAKMEHAKRRNDSLRKQVALLRLQIEERI